MCAVRHCCCPHLLQPAAVCDLQCNRLHTLLQEKGNANAVWWARRCLAVLGGGWDKVGLRQLSGMLVLIFARQVRGCFAFAVSSIWFGQY